MDMIDLSPPASSLIESIRSIGYSFDAAVADIIDNSISAGASKVAVNLNYLNDKSVSVTIVDDGRGMSPPELRLAMSLGGRGPGEKRGADDLGRFGLGLKTASFSQAKRLTVISRASLDENYYGIEWDLNVVIASNKWEARELSHDDCCNELLTFKIKPFDVGTAVIWSDCDRLINDSEGGDEVANHLNRLFDELKKKLSLIFHKYIDKSNFNIKVNDSTLKAMDPFATKGKDGYATSQLLFKETRSVDSSEISITGYLLPHISRMGGAAREREISIDAEHTGSQGLYLYRNNRLIAYGGWQQIVRKTEANKLARLEICFGNDADHLWQLDIKKSTATLPIALRSRLRDLIRGISNRSNEVFVRRVQMKKSNPNSVWERIYDKETKSITYQIDRSHPIVEKLLESFDGKDELVDDLLVFIENTFPVDLISNDVVAGDGSIPRSIQETESQISELAEIVSEAGLSFDMFKATVMGCGLYKLNPKELDDLINHYKDLFENE
ncbi:ATP-binding protein [Polynucleobacter sp. es-EL-1]|uniref:ATP-binding protein n=1 Tax=Polynucleobacter sp. es-EL-1 TaxID=1855652 RepID=UPI001BFD4373|nr:ATP-binding protein [Polynucleobacter sp. es-EL-1]QWE11176.1 ATP-binding protein [Polynucleobacter sp. es-EL-1]